MSDSNFTTRGNEPLEARIVAWVLGEASAFEVDELKRLCEEQPELAVFKRRVEAVHGLVGEASQAKPKTDEDWKLSPVRRDVIEELMPPPHGFVTEAMDKDKVHDIRETARERSIRRSSRRALLAVAACLVMTVVVATLTWPVFFSRKDEMMMSSYSESNSIVDFAFESEEKSDAQFFQSLKSAPLAKKAEHNQLNERAQNRPASPSNSVAKEITSSSVAEYAVPVPEVSVTKPSVDSGNEDELGFGWGGGGLLESGEAALSAKQTPKPGKGLASAPASRKPDLNPPAAPPSAVGGDGRKSESFEEGYKYMAGGQKRTEPSETEHVARAGMKAKGLQDTNGLSDEVATNSPGDPFSADTPLDALTEAKVDADRGEVGYSVSGNKLGATYHQEHLFRGVDMSGGGVGSGGVAPAPSAFPVVPANPAGPSDYDAPELEPMPGSGVERADRLASNNRELESGTAEGETYFQGGGPNRSLGNDKLNVAGLSQNGLLDGSEKSLGLDAKHEALGERRKNLEGLESSTRFYAFDPEPSEVADQLHSSGAMTHGELAELKRKLGDKEGQTFFADDAVEESLQNHSANANDVSRFKLLADRLYELEDLKKQQPDNPNVASELDAVRDELTVKSRAQLTTTEDEAKDKVEVRERPIATDEEIAAAQEPYSTFSLNINDASFRVAQAALAKGEMPDPTAIKVEQFYNAVDYGDPSPAAGQPVASKIDQTAHPVIPGRNLVRVAIKTASEGRSQGQPLRLTLLIDQSGSMAREDRRQAMVEALDGLRGLLNDNDQINVIGFSRTPRLLAEAVNGNQGELANLVKIEANEGGTNLEEAIKLGEQLALRHHVEGAQNRLVLFTDGAANLGNADPDALAEKIKDLRHKDIAFDIAGIVADGLNDDLLGEMARHGDGRYYVVGKGGKDRFAEQLAGAFRPAAENVKVQVHFNPERVGRYKLIGFEKDRLNKEDFRNDAVDAAEMAAEEAGVAIYQVETLPEGEGEIGEVSVRFRDVASGQMVERSWTIANEIATPALDQARPSMQLATLAMMAAEKLKGGPLADAINFNEMNEVIAKVNQHYKGDPKAAEMLEMIDQLK